MMTTLSPLWNNKIDKNVWQRLLLQRQQKATNHVHIRKFSMGYQQRLWLLGILCLTGIYSYQSTLYWNRQLPWISLEFQTNHMNCNTSTAATALLQDQDAPPPPLPTATAITQATQAITDTAATADTATKGTQYGPIGVLRWNWTHLTIQSPLAKEFAAHQSNCDLPLQYFQERNKVGMGSELHLYGMALCNAHRRGTRMFTANRWMYVSRQDCQNVTSQSVMACYFPKLELQCPGDELRAEQIMNESRAMKLVNPGMHRVKYRAKEDVQCQSMLKKPQYSSLYNIMDVRAAITELQFSQLSQVVVKEAQRQHALVFPRGAPPPNQLITVHIRWGDKRKEMKLQPIEKYIEAIESVAQQRNLLPHQVHLFLSTEDPRALQEFMSLKPSPWNVHVDQFMYEMLPHRNNQTQEVAGSAKAGVDKSGLWALGSLLVAMEADSYILTTESNWSRLMNELRKAIVRAQQCPAPHHPTPTENGLSPHHYVNSTYFVQYNSTTNADCTTFLDISGKEFFG